ncbi:hypothetical protein ACE1SV_05970 [Streptomyces sennicomposti]
MRGDEGRAVRLRLARSVTGSRRPMIPYLFTRIPHWSVMPPRVPVKRSARRRPERETAMAAEGRPPE